MNQDPPQKSRPVQSQLVLTDLSKRYGRVQALAGVSLTFDPGEIHAVLGENGAGKSTLVSIMSGFVSPDAGSAVWRGEPLRFGSPAACKAAGIEMIHQHFTLVPGFTVQENLALARLGVEHGGLLGPLATRDLAQEALATAAELGWDFDPSQRVQSLSVGAQQRLEIIKALSSKASVIIFDEPTAVLSVEEVEDLFRVLRELRDSGKIVVLIAHKLAEVLSVADRVSVLRKGKLVAGSRADEVDAATLAHWMVGDMAEPTGRRSTPSRTQTGLVVSELRAIGDRGLESVQGVSFEARRGEIVGIGGVDGNGQTELAEVIAAVRPFFAGNAEFDGVPIGSDSLSISYIPQDRRTDGLALRMSVSENLIISGYRKPALCWGPWLRNRAIRRWVANLIDRFSIKVDSSDEPVSSLSGGNQQKVVVSRCLDETPDLLIAANPTRGLDLKATQFVHECILGAASDGAAVVVVSTDIDELNLLSDRVLSMYGGKLLAGAGAVAILGGASD